MSTTEMLVRKTIVVARSPEAAFRVFTEEMDGWWPAATHSVGQKRVTAVVCEVGVGGRIYERLEDGTEHEWGRIREWDPPHRLAYTWYPGRGPETGQVVEIRFSAQGDGSRVDLEHRGWERLGDDAEAVRANYDGESGWSRVLGPYAEAVGKS